ncbi:MAG: hypothetical protein L0177_16680 [Chloroflexi bacterium]|nr:hypothetical protein [Chloroflexota bacterium]
MLSKKNKLKILKKARSLVVRPNGWVKGEYVSPLATDEKGETFYAFCSAGAVWEAHKDVMNAPLSPEQLDQLCDELSISALAKAKLSGRSALLSRVDSIGIAPLVVFNDAATTRKADVVALFDEKIAELEATS